VQIKETLEILWHGIGATFFYKKKLAKSHPKLKLKIKNLKMKSFWRFSEVRGEN
jgi:hypothetical protein